MTFGEFLYNQFDADENKRMIFIDDENLNEKYRFTDYFERNGFVVFYDIENFCNAVSPQCRVGSSKNLLLITKADCYIPKDLKEICDIRKISLEDIFSELNPKAVKEKIITKSQMNLLCMAYIEYPPTDLNYSKTIDYISQKVLTSENIFIYIKAKEFELDFLSQNAKSPFDWYKIADLKAELEFLTLEYNLDYKQSNEILYLLNKYNTHFQDYINSKYSSLPSYFTSSESPILVKNVLSYIKEKSRKFALIVMDGMSLLDWKNISKSFIHASSKFEKHGFKIPSLLSNRMLPCKRAPWMASESQSEDCVAIQKKDKNNNYFNKITLKESFVYAMLPTITSISRQSLLSGKFPKELSRPWDMTNEEKEFRNSAIKLGYKDYEICYLKGLVNEINFNTKALAIIINDIDDLVHKSQNKNMLYNSIKICNISRKLEIIVNSLLEKGFDVYITADHGNTQCLGIGNEKKFGVETASKGKRMLVLKDFANKKELIEKYNLIEIPKDYLMNEYDYFVCSSNSAFENNNTQLMSHGGITLDEVIVPFIEVKCEN